MGRRISECDREFPVLAWRSSLSDLTFSSNIIRESQPNLRFRRFCCIAGQHAPRSLRFPPIDRNGWRKLATLLVIPTRTGSVLTEVAIRRCTELVNWKSFAARRHYKVETLNLAGPGRARWRPRLEHLQAQPQTSIDNGGLRDRHRDRIGLAARRVRRHCAEAFAVLGRQREPGAARQWPGRDLEFDG